MSFLKRMFEPARVLVPHDVSSGEGYCHLEVAETSRHACPFPSQKRLGTSRNEQAVATLELDPGHGPNAVRVKINGSTVGYLPAEASSGWSRYIATLEESGHRAQAHAEVWVGYHGPWAVRLEMDYSTPQEIAEREARRAAWEAAGLCPQCGSEVDRSKNKTRKLCLTCRPARTGGATAT